MAKDVPCSLDGFLLTGAKTMDIVGQQLMVNVEAEQVMIREMTGGERLLWASKPATGIRLRALDIFLIPFSVIWTGVAIFWEAAVIQQGAPLFFVLWGVPFVVMGMYFVAGRFFVDAWQRSRTYYGITDQRVIILSGVFCRRMKSLPLRTLSDISVSEKSDGTGSITLATGSPMLAWFSSAAWPGMEQFGPPSFEQIQDVRLIYDRLLNAHRLRAEGATVRF